MTRDNDTVTDNLVQPGDGPVRRRFAQPDLHGTTRQPELTIVVPTRNEAGNVAALIDLIDHALAGIELEVIFVDDSDDETPAAIAAARARSGRCIRLVHRDPGERSGGLGGAVVVGIGQARAPWVCVMDGDLQHPPATVRSMLARARAGGYDVVVGSRFCGTGTVGEFGRVRTALSRGSALLAKAIFPRRLAKVSDPMSGFFLVRRDAVEIAHLRPHGFKILLEILGRTPMLQVSEVPFTFGTRHSGKTKASVREAGRFLAHLWRLRVGDLGLRAGRFSVVGTTGLAVNTALLALLVEVAGIGYVLAAILATQGSTLWNFVLTDRWVFPGRAWRHGLARRMLMYFALNNASHAIRIPLLVLLASGLGINYLVANLLTLLAMFAVRFALADGMIWAGSRAQELAPRTWNYDIHGIVTVRSDGRLPELEAFRIDIELEEPTIRVRLGKLRAPDRRSARSPHRALYLEAGGRGFAVQVDPGERTEVVASAWLRHSPHVLYTNVVEPVLRWTFVRKGYALVHAACVAADGRAFLVTAKTDTGKTTTILKTLDAHPYCFVSDDLTIVATDGRVLTYPKPLTISRHTLHAVKTPLLTRRERAGLVVQSRLHSRSGRLFGMILARLRLPAATMNAIVQWLVPPPKYPVDRLIPGVAIAPEAELAGMVVIERGGTGDSKMAPDEALATLLANCDDAYGFPPYPEIATFLHSNGDKLLERERQIVQSALARIPTTHMRSETMDWAERLLGLLASVSVPGGNGRTTQPPAEPEPLLQLADLHDREALHEDEALAERGAPDPTPTASD